MSEENIEKISKEELLENIRTWRAKLEETLDQLSDEQLQEPGLEGGWSVKDVMAHLAAWEQKMIAWAKQYIGGTEPNDRPQNDDDINAMNAQLHESNKGKSLEEVRTAFKESYPQAVALTESVPEDILMDSDRFPSRNGNPLWYMIAANTWWHYEEHNEDIQRWLAGKDK